MSSEDLPELPEFESDVDTEAVVATVFELHDAMDLFKEWSALTTMRIEREIDGLDAEPERRADLLDLIEWVESVRRRLVLSEAESLERSSFAEDEA